MVLISLPENNKHRIAWAGFLTENSSVNYSPNIEKNFVEIEGEVLLLRPFEQDIYLLHSYFADNVKKYQFPDDEVSLDKIVREINKESASPLVSSYCTQFLFDKGGVFFHRQILCSPLFGEIVYGNITVENGVFCFEVENKSYPRKGKIWIDMRKKEVMKVVDLTDREILDKIPKGLFWE